MESLEVTELMHRKYSRSSSLSLAWPPCQGRPSFQNRKRHSVFKMPNKPVSVYFPFAHKHFILPSMPLVRVLFFPVFLDYRQALFTIAYFTPLHMHCLMPWYHWMASCVGKPPVHHISQQCLPWLTDMTSAFFHGWRSYTTKAQCLAPIYNGRHAKRPSSPTSCCLVWHKSHYNCIVCIFLDKDNSRVPFQVVGV